MEILLLPPNAIFRREVEEMWALYGPHHNVLRPHFEARLLGFAQVAVFREEGRIAGFTGVRFRRFVVEGSPCQTIYFGQTFLDPSARGRQLIQRTVTRLFLTERARSPLVPWFFWSDALSYKPYLVMARNLDLFFPHPTLPTPPRIRALLDRIGEAYYPGLYDPSSGTVRRPEARLKEHVAPISEQDLSDPFLRFYAQKNPGHAAGHGLLVLCPMTLHNLLSYLRRRLVRWSLP